MQKYSAKNSSEKKYICSATNGQNAQTSLHCVEIKDEVSNQTAIPVRTPKPKDSVSRSPKIPRNNHVLVAGPAPAPMSPYAEVKALFPGDKNPAIPDFLFLGAGVTGLVTMRKLVDMGYRVLAIETGLDQSANPVIAQFFGQAPFKGDGAVIPNSIGAAIDPNWNEFTGGVTKAPGAGNRVDHIWACSGVGGGGLHFFGVWQLPLAENLDGPLPSAVLPPGISNTRSMVQAGGSAWSSTAFYAAIKAAETYYGSSENLAARGAAGPIKIIQNAGGEDLNIVGAMSDAALLVTGGATCAVVSDTNNVATAANSIGPVQIAVDPMTYTRSNTWTAYGAGLLVPDSKGNLISNNPAKKWVVWTNSAVTRVVPNKPACTASSYVAGGAEFMKNNDIFFVQGKNIVSCMGAAASPLMWQRSGFGPAAVLAKIGVPKAVISPSLEFIGQQMMSQYGPSLHFSSTSPTFGQDFPAWGYIQYNGVPRRCTVAVAGFHDTPFGLETPWAALDEFDTAGNRLYHFYSLLYIDQPRSRGYLNCVRANHSTHPDINFGWYTDGPVPNDPASGLVANGGSVDSDIQIACSLIDYMSNVISALQAGGNPNGIQWGIEFDTSLLSPVVPGITGTGPGTLAYQKATENVRFPQMVPFVTMFNFPQDHETGTMAMGPNANSGVVNGNLRLYGSKNCFELSKSIFPVHVASGPYASLVAVGNIAANVIKQVAM